MWKALEEIVRLGIRLDEDEVREPGRDMWATWLQVNVSIQHTARRLY